MKGRRAITQAGVLALLAGLAIPSVGISRTLEVGADSPYATIAAALADAGSGDTIRVAAGTYRESLRIELPVTLIGVGWPVVDAGGVGHVVDARAALEIRGFVLRGSGSDMRAEDAGLIARGTAVRVVGNRLEDVLYGIYLKQAPGSLVVGNRIRGKPLPFARRGDGIRLWYSPNTKIAGNDIRGARDVVMYFSDHLSIEDNVVRDGRYGLHSMYTSHSRLSGNRLSDNHVGAYLMYSADIELTDNVIAKAVGSSGIGLGLKDSDLVAVRRNLFLENAVGVHLDNSPGSVDRVNEFEDNTFALNGVAVRILPSVTGNRFWENDFLANDVPVRVAGGARADQVRQNEWTGNYWSDHAGFDRDGDGAGDAPYVYAHLADELLERRPALRIFALAPVLDALDALSRFFPLLRPAPVVLDEAPRMTMHAAHAWREERKGIGDSGWGTVAEIAGWGLVAMGALTTLALGGGRRSADR